jgi:hypothetical protein
VDFITGRLRIAFLGFVLLGCQDGSTLRDARPRTASIEYMMESGDVDDRGRTASKLTPKYVRQHIDMFAKWLRSEQVPGVRDELVFAWLDAYQPGDVRMLFDKIGGKSFKKIMPNLSYYRWKFSNSDQDFYVSLGGQWSKFQEVKRGKKNKQLGK